MSSCMKEGKGEGEQQERVAAAAAASQWCWSRISPSNLDHRQRLPTAITLHRLVPRPSPSTHHAAASTSTFKYITPEEIKAAQMQARQEVLTSRVDPPMPAASDTPAPPSPQNKKHPNRKKDGSGSQASFACRLGSGEVGLRRRQLTRLVSQISRTLVDLQDLSEPRQRDFVAPLELEIKKRRWNECARLMRRSLFVLKQEVVALERESGQGTRTSHHLRALAATARTINTQLMTLKSQAQSSCDPAWTEVLEEFIGVARKILVLAARVGVQSPPSSVKWFALPEERVAGGSEDTSGQESAITISDVDSTNIHLLQSGHVRDRLARLAARHFKRRKKKSQNSTMTERRQNKQYVVLEPLKRHHDGKGNMSLDITATHQSPASPSHLKEGDGNTTDVTSAPRNTSHSYLHSQPSVCKTSASIPSHDSSSRTNAAAAPQIQTSQTQTSNVPESQPQLPPCQSDLPASKSYINMLPHANLSAKNLTEQLSFLLQRVCKLEDNKRTTEALIAEASQVTHSPVVTQSLGDAVQQARLVLTAVRDAVPHPQPLVPNTGITGFDSLPKNTGLSIKVPERVPPRTSPDEVGGSFCSQEVEKDVNPLEGKWLTGESVMEQVRRQKEQFWRSLAEQGFVRPPETLPRAGEKSCSDQSVSFKEPYKNTSEEKLKQTSPKKAVSRTHVHQQTQTKPPKHCQSSSKKDSNSGFSSYTSSNNKIQPSTSDSKIKCDAPSADGKQSFSIESQLQQNVPAENTSSGVPSSTETESQSFPSYEGVASPRE
ncbi:uncharacterized protein LOC123499837 isoform X2 [Portunus trituberculatus]|uniref:uncharacterized protein LOC123499837 isoform X2 n=1 Tax=Portunus trituberculatus TaxID=210409 RepID=UPI001E1CF477|nr:uncharacterized protein LOC123499837 isoform X2 [Portunus trituberculatus]